MPPPVISPSFYQVDDAHNKQKTTWTSLAEDILSAELRLSHETLKADPVYQEKIATLAKEIKAQNTAANLEEVRKAGIYIDKKELAHEGKDHALHGHKVYVDLSKTTLFAPRPTLSIAPKELAPGFRSEDDPSKMIAITQMSVVSSQAAVNPVPNLTSASDLSNKEQEQNNAEAPKNADDAMSDADHPLKSDTKKIYVACDIEGLEETGEYSPTPLSSQSMLAILNNMPKVNTDVVARFEEAILDAPTELSTNLFYKLERTLGNQQHQLVTLCEDPNMFDADQQKQILATLNTLKRAYADNIEVVEVKRPVLDKSIYADIDHLKGKLTAYQLDIERMIENYTLALKQGIAKQPDAMQASDPPSDNVVSKQRP